MWSPESSEFHGLRLAPQFVQNDTSGVAGFPRNSSLAISEPRPPRGCHPLRWGLNTGSDDFRLCLFLLRRMNQGRRGWLCQNQGETFLSLKEWWRGQPEKGNPRRLPRDGCTMFTISAAGHGEVRVGDRSIRQSLGPRTPSKREAVPGFDCLRVPT